MFTLSAFADEISADPQEQVDVLLATGVRHIEFRSILKTNVLALSDHPRDYANAPSSSPRDRSILQLADLLWQDRASDTGTSTKGDSSRFGESILDPMDRLHDLRNGSSGGAGSGRQEELS